jgi:hypothetical protein
MHDVVNSGGRRHLHVKNGFAGLSSAETARCNVNKTICHSGTRKEIIIEKKEENVKKQWGLKKGVMRTLKYICLPETQQIFGVDERDHR